MKIMPKHALYNVKLLLKKNTDTHTNSDIWANSYNADKHMHITMYRVDYISSNQTISSENCAYQDKSCIF